VANVDEWKWKLSMLLRNEKDQEIVSRDKRDRRDYEQIANLAKRMGLYRYKILIFVCHMEYENNIYLLEVSSLWSTFNDYFNLLNESLFVLINHRSILSFILMYSELFGKVVVASKVPLPNYRPDLDDKRPQREVISLETQINLQPFCGVECFN